MDQIEQVLTSMISTLPEVAMAAMLGMDGIGVRIAFSDAWENLAPEVVEVELAALAVAVQKAAQGIEANTSPSFFLGTAQSNFMGTMLGPSYFLVLGLEPSADLDRARDLLVEAQQALEEMGPPSD